MTTLNLSGGPQQNPLNMSGAPTQPLIPIKLPQIDNPLTIQKAQAQAIPQQNPQVPVTPTYVIPKTRAVDMRTQMGDPALMHTLYNTDPAFKEKVDAMQPFYQSQSQDWQQRFPTFAINKYYGIDPTKPADSVTNTVLSGMTQPQQPGFWQKVGLGLMGPINAGIHIAKGIGTDIQNGAQDIMNQATHVSNPQDNAMGMFAKNLLPTMGAMGSTAANVINEPLKPIENSVMQGAMMIPGVKDALTKLQEGAQQLQQAHPELARQIIGGTKLSSFPLAAMGTAAAIKGGINTVTNLGESAINSANTVAGEVKGGIFNPPTPEELKAKLDSTVGKIIQGKTEDIQGATKALANLDTKGVKTYDDLSSLVKNQTSALSQKQDELLSQFPDAHPVSDFNTTIGKITTNPVNTAIDHLKELYTNSARYQDLARIQDLQTTAESQGLSLQQVNDLAREYGIEKSGFSNTTGNPLTSVNAKMYENTRKALKSSFRDLLPDPIKQASIGIDTGISNNINLNDLTDKMVESVNQLQQKIVKRGIVETIANKTSKIADALTLHSLRGLLTGIAQSNVGLKTMNSIAIEKALSGNLSKVTDLLSQMDTMTNDQAANAIVDLIKEGGTTLQNSQPLAAAGISQQAQGMINTSHSTLPESSLHVNPIESAKVGDTIQIPISTDTILPPKGVSMRSWTLDSIAKHPSPGMSENVSGPIDATLEGGKVRITDGLHRLGEAIRNGDKTIHIRIVP